MFANTVSLPATPVLRLLRVARRFVAALVPARRGPVHGAEELMGMSERELSDLGIGRSEIPHVMDAQARGARSCAWRG
jgi:uncharacterized protein YjiS (DUF1127 family)